MSDAQRQYQPLIDEIKAVTGLDSWVWQSGGMTMTLVTGSGDPYQGDRYLTLVEGGGAALRAERCRPAAGNS